MKKNKSTKILAVIVIILLIAIGISMAVFFMGNQKEDKLVVMVDGAYDSATGKSGLVEEYVLNEAVSDALVEKLSKNSAIVTVEKSHESGENASNEMRQEKIKEVKPDLIVSLRCTADGYGDTNTRIFTNIPSMKKNEEGLKWANCFQTAYQNAGIEVPVNYYYYHPIRTEVYQEHIVDSDDRTDYQEETFSIMGQGDISCVVINMINISNEEQVSLYHSEEGIQQLAEIYSDAILNGVKEIYAGE